MMPPMVLLPNTRLTPCPSCAELIRAGADRCPHCDKDMSEGAGSMLCSAALLWTSLTLSGCVISAVYGVPTTTEVSASGGETDTDTQGESSGEGTTTEPTSSGTMGGTEGQTTTGPTTGMTGTTGTSDGSGSSGTTAQTTGTSDQPLYGAVDPVD